MKSVKELKKNPEGDKIWCPYSESFRYVTVCLNCKKKIKCESYKDYLEPKLL